MRQILRPLQEDGLSASVLTVPRLSEEVRNRIREELGKRKWSFRHAARLLDWNASSVYHLMDGTVEFRVDDVEAFGTILQMRPTELVRDRGLEFVADMTPTELRLFERIRALDPKQRDAIMTVLHIAAPEARRALPKRAVKHGRGVR